MGKGCSPRPNICNRLGWYPASMSVRRVIELIVAVSLRYLHNTWRHGMKGKRTRNRDKIRLAMGTRMLNAGSLSMKKSHISNSDFSFLDLTLNAFANVNDARK